MYDNCGFSSITLFSPSLRGWESLRPEILCVHRLLPSTHHNNHTRTAGHLPSSHTYHPQTRQTIFQSVRRTLTNHIRLYWTQIHHHPIASMHNTFYLSIYNNIISAFI